MLIVVYVKFFSEMATKHYLPYEMELFRTEDYYVLLNSVSSLWCSRKSGEILVKPGKCSQIK